MRTRKRRPLIVLFYGIAIIVAVTVLLSARFMSGFTLFFEERSAVDSITICIKMVSSFRGDSFHLLYDSIRSRYPNVPIIAVDDSIAPKNIAMQKYLTDEHFSLFLLPPRVGVSASRNYMLERVRTPFYMNMDDDMIFTNATDLLAIVRRLKGPFSPDILTLGVEQHDKIMSYQHTFSFIKSCAQRDAGAAGLMHTDGKVFRRTFPERRVQSLTVYLEPRGDPEVDTCAPVDIGMNIFVAKTESLKRLKWNPSIHQYDHELFFLRAHAFGLKTESCPDRKSVV